MVSRNDNTGNVNELRDRVHQVVDAILEAVLAPPPAPVRGEWFRWEDLPPGITKRAALEAGKGGAFPLFKLGRCTVARTDDVEAWLASKVKPRVARPEAKRSGWAATPRTPARRDFPRSLR